MDYKKEQAKSRKALKERRVLWQGGTLNLKIKAFKRDHRSDYYLINTFKQNAWASLKKKR